MHIQPASLQQRSQVVALLQSNNLPFEDLPGTLDDFLVAMAENKIVGAIGIEQYGSYGLLRSMVVDPAWRNRQLAGSLVAALEINATANGLTEIYLLTETADLYFERKGYQRITRDEVPSPLLASTEFSHVCPASAVVMKKTLSVLS